jgi:hypothetical protein
MHILSGYSDFPKARKPSIEEKARRIQADAKFAEDFAPRLEEALDDVLDEALEDTFPASDPVSSLRTD